MEVNLFYKYRSRCRLNLRYNDAALGIDNSFNHILLKIGFQWRSGQKHVADILSPSICKQVWIGTQIIKFSIIKKWEIFIKGGCDELCYFDMSQRCIVLNLTKIYMHTEKDYLTSVWLKLKINFVNFVSYCKIRTT